MQHFLYITMYYYKKNYVDCRYIYTIQIHRSIPWILILIRMLCNIILKAMVGFSEVEMWVQRVQVYLNENYCSRYIQTKVAYQTQKDDWMQKENRMPVWFISIQTTLVQITDTIQHQLQTNTDATMDPVVTYVPVIFNGPSNWIDSFTLLSIGCIVVSW